MINIYQIFRKKDVKDVVFVGSLADCQGIMRQAHTIVGSSIFEISEATLEALAMRDSLSKKAIFHFRDDVGQVRIIYTLHQSPKYIGEYPPRGMDDYYGESKGDFDTGTGLFLPSGYVSKPQVTNKDRVQQYLAKLKKDASKEKKSNAPKKTEKKGKK